MPPQPPRKTETQFPSQSVVTQQTSTKVEARQSAREVKPKEESQVPPQPKRQAPGPPTSVNDTSVKGESSKSFLRTSEEHMSESLENSGSQSLCK